MAPQNYPELGKWASPLCPPSVTVTLDESQLRQSQKDWRWRLSALLSIRGRNHLIERRSRQRLTVSTYSTHPCAYLVLSVFFILVILVGVYWYAIVDFTLHFSKVNNIHMLIGHWLSSSVMYLFMSFAHCLNGLFVFLLYINISALYFLDVYL